jgi:glutaredoxin 3
MQKVIIYTSDTCGYCHKAKAFLKANGVPFIEKKVDLDPVAQQEMAQMKAQGVPVIKIDDEIMMGFNEPRLEALFGKKIVECPECRTKMRLPKNKGVLQATCPNCQTKFKVDSNR